jgi:hypothetical protein
MKHGEVNMKYLNYIKIVLVFILIVPPLSFAENGNKGNVKGTYTLQVSQDCVLGGTNFPSQFLIIKEGEFTLDGQGGFIYRSDGIFIGNGFMGQFDEFCTGAYFVVRGRNNVVVNIPQQTCIGKTGSGSGGYPQEPEPRIFSNYTTDLLDVSLIFQQGGKKAGIYSDIPPPETPVDVETIVFSSNPNNPEMRRCGRIGTFNRKGIFSVLTAPVPAPPPAQ